MTDKQSVIEISYKYIRNRITPKDMCSITFTFFNNFYEENRKKKIEDKCIEFMIFRQSCIGYIIEHYLSNETDKITLNSLVDYFDCSFSVLFFKNKFELKPINEIIDHEFYFSLLPFVIDRIEFPSMFKNEIIESLKSNDRLRINLKRRNFLSNLLLFSRDFVNHVTIELANQNQYVPTYVEITKTLKKNKSIFLNRVASINDKHEKYLSKQRINKNKFIVYRGYDIDKSEDVLIDRKIRIQDANKSCSFTVNSEVAKMFSKYKTFNQSKSLTTTYDDRLTLVSSFVDNSLIKNYQCKLNRKFIFAKYELDEKDIIITPFSTTTTECEVIAIPDNAKLLRYCIVNVS